RMYTRLFRMLLVALAVLLGAGIILAPAGAQSADLDAFVQRALADYGVPGAAVGILQQGQPVVVRGYGVRRLGDASPVDGDTVFQLAPVTKSFTAAALGALVDEQRLTWDDPVIQSLPELVLYDSATTRSATTRDFLAHRSGLPTFGGDLLGQLGYD